MSPPKIKPEVRDRIRHFLNAGHCITMVIKACKSEGLTVSHATVQKVRNGGYESKGTTEVKSIRGRPLSVMTKSKLNLLQKMTSDSNPITQRERAKKLKVSQRNVNYHIHKTQNADKKGGQSTCILSTKH